MLRPEMLFGHEKVTIQRPKGKSTRNEGDWKQVTQKDGAPKVIRAKIERRVQRRRSREGTEIVGDAAMSYAESEVKGQRVKLKAGDRIVTPRGEVFSINDISEARLVGVRKPYFRATLDKVRTEVGTVEPVEA